MKKIFLLSVLIFMAVIAYGQSSKLSLGITGSPDFYNYQFKVINGFNHEYKKNTNYSLGLSINYNVCEKFAVSTGLIFSTKGYSLDYTWIVSDANDPLIPVESNFNVQYLEVPILASFNFLTKEKMSLFTSTGFVNSFLINDKVVSTMGDGSENETEFSKITLNQKLNKFLFAVNLEIGIKYNINEKLYFSTAPYLRVGLNKISDEVLKSNPISYGANFGLHYRL